MFYTFVCSLLLYIFVALKTHSGHFVCFSNYLIAVYYHDIKEFTVKIFCFTPRLELTWKDNKGDVAVVISHNSTLVFTIFMFQFLLKCDIFKYTCKTHFMGLSRFIPGVSVLIILAALRFFYFNLRWVQGVWLMFHVQIVW